MGSSLKLCPVSCILFRIWRRCSTGKPTKRWAIRSAADLSMSDTRHFIHHFFNIGQAVLGQRQTAAGESLNKFVQLRFLENQAQRDVDPQARVNSGNQLCGQQRMAAQFEEIVAQPDALDFQHVGPDRSHLLLLFSRRRDVLALQLAGVRCRQGFAIQLAVGAQRHACQPDEVGRHHVIGQCFLEIHLECITQVIATVLSHQIGCQLLAGWAVNVDNYSFLNVFVFQKAGFDLAQLDTQAANLHLMV
ncbi:Linear gramicidin synthetase subunit D, partial [Pseudomonas amygdali pv. eriobotryae]